MAAVIIWVSLSVFLFCFNVESRPLLFHLQPEAPHSANWLWNWTFGGGASSTVSVVDRSPIISYESRPAAFGPEMKDPVLGYVIPLSSFTTPCSSHNDSVIISENNNYGCPKRCLSGPNQPDPSETWIALVQRGGCEFAAKVREAQRLGAKAVVVGGSNPDETGAPDTLLNMFSPEDASDIVTPSTYITYLSYASLNDLILSSNTSHNQILTVSLFITAEYSGWEWYSPIVTFFVILILPSIITILTLLIHRVRSVRQKRRERAPEDFVKQLPWSIWNGQNSILEKQYDSGVKPDLIQESEGASSSNPPHPWYENQVECAICLCDFAIGDKVRILPCHHIFHMDEVDEWLVKRKKLCPICKSDVTLQPGSESENAGDDVEANPSPSPQEHEESTETTPLLTSGSS